MTQKLQDLLTPFLGLTVEEQFAKIKEVRDTRSIERPAVAKRRRKKRDKQVRKAGDQFKSLVKKMSPEERAELLAKLGGG